MLKVIEDEAAIRRHQRLFAKAMRAQVKETIPVKLGHPGASEKAKVAWSEEHGIWFFSRKIAGSRYWNAFGVGRPEGGAGSRNHLRDQFPPLRHRPPNRRRLRPGARRSHLRRPSGKTRRRAKGDREIPVREHLSRRLGGDGGRWRGDAGRPDRGPPLPALRPADRPVRPEDRPDQGVGRRPLSPRRS